ncbi:MAG: hypothetical protein V4819_09220 [Verrucomicrobiota bacterium]
MSEETIIARSPVRTAISWIVRGVLCCVVILFFLLMIQSVVIIEVPIHFLFGWVFHGMTTLPPLLGNWRMLLLPAGCLVLAGVLIHRFVCRSLKAKEVYLVWRPTHTLAFLALLLLGCGAAIALSGVVHQSVWLMGDRWIENRGRRAELTEAVNNARQLMMALMEFHDEKGHYPNSLQELESELNIPHQLVWLKTGNGKVPEPFILLHPGGTRPMNADEPLIVSPVIQRDGKVAVGYGDCSVRSLPVSKLASVLAGEENVSSIK